MKKMPMLKFLTYFCFTFLIIKNEISLAQQTSGILEAQVSVGALAISQTPGSSWTFGAMDLSTMYYRPDSEVQKLLPFRIEYWVGNSVSPNELRILEGNVASILLKHGLSSEVVQFKHASYGVGSEQVSFNAFTPVIVNYKKELQSDGRVVLTGFLGAGLAYGLNRNESVIRDLGRELPGFYLPAGVKVYGESEYLRWAVGADFAQGATNSGQKVSEGPRTKVFEEQNLKMQSFHLGAEAELKLEALVKSKLLKPISLFVKVDVSQVTLNNHYQKVQISKISGDREVLSENHEQLNRFNNNSAQVGIRINLQKKRK